MNLVGLQQRVQSFIFQALTQGGLPVMDVYVYDNVIPELLQVMPHFQIRAVFEGGFQSSATLGLSRGEPESGVLDKARECVKLLAETYRRSAGENPSSDAVRTLWWEKKKAEQRQRKAAEEEKKPTIFSGNFNPKALAIGQIWINTSDGSMWVGTDDGPVKVSGGTTLPTSSLQYETPSNIPDSPKEEEEKPRPRRKLDLDL